MTHALSCPKEGIFLARHNNTSEEWGALSDQALNPSFISYKPKIKIRTVKAERNRAGARVDTGSQAGGGDKKGEGETGQATVPDESRADVSVHGFCKWVTPSTQDRRE